MQAPKIKFTYFDKIDRPEPIRLAMMIAGIPFEDDRVSLERWRSMKESTPFGSLPIMEVDGKVYSYANALLRYVGHIGKLLPSDPIKVLAVDQVIGTVDDIIFAVKPTLHIRDHSRKISEQNQLASKDIPQIFRGLDQVICRESKQFCVGNQYTVADVALFNLVHVRHNRGYSQRHQRRIPEHLPGLR